MTIYISLVIFPKILLLIYFIFFSIRKRRRRSHGIRINGNTKRKARALLTKGPRYRLPNLIDFEKCRIQIAEALQSFAKRWCGREHAEHRALSEWKKQIFNIIDKRISFYTSNPDLLPPKPKFLYRDLKSSIQNFHSKYVLVPADKASNNVIII